VNRERAVSAPRWTLPVLALALLHVALGLAGIALALADPGLPLPSSHSLWVHLVQILVFGATGLWLVGGSRGDARPAYLGAIFLLVATGYAWRPIELVAGAAPPAAATLARAALAVPPDAFLGLFFWLFVRDFPRAIGSPRARRLVKLMVWTATAAAAFLILAHASIEARAAASPGARPASWLLGFHRRDPASHYWTLLFGLIVPALPFMAWRTRTARAEERRRVALFVAGLVVGSAPAVLYISLGFLLLERARSSGLDRYFMPAIQLGVLSMPLLAAYSVAVDRVMDVRLILRTTLRYALARWSVAASAAAPFLVLAVLLVRERAVPVGELFSGWRFLALGGLGALGLGALRFREGVVEALDRRFFREQYDARQILITLVERVRGVGSRSDLARLLVAEIDRALHLDAVSMLALSAPGRDLEPVAGGGRPLACASALATRLAASGETLVLDLEGPGDSSPRLPPAEREWIAERGYRLLVPLRGSAGALLGLLALGTKKSELPFSREDRLLLDAIAASGAVHLERLLLRSSAGGARSPADDAEPGRECPACGLLPAAQPASCPACGTPTVDSPIPHVVLGKFRLERRLGAGGMGVVYHGVDLELGRDVALKTLPRVSPERAVRLRREARAMAAVVHPHLALVYGLETCRGTPLLICEYLAGGTLAERLARGPLPPREAVELGIVLAGVLERVHGAGILHRDVKPSNIGFSREGTPKLMDFGLARMLADSPVDPPVRRLDSAASGAPAVRATLVTEEGLGTPLYLSPEALAGAEPDVSFDLWSTTVLLFEAVAGRHPLERDSWLETMAAISRALVPDLRELSPGCPEALALFFRDALAGERARRPGSARELRQDLERLAA
jgi:hypothetical protein